MKFYQQFRTLKRSNGALLLSPLHSMISSFFKDVLLRENGYPISHLVIAYLPLVACQRLVVAGGPIWSWQNMSPDSTYAKSFIKLLLDEADKGSL